MNTETLARQDLLQIAAEYADFCVLVTTPDMDEPGPQVLFVNAAWTRMTGYSRSEIIGKTPRILQGPETDTKMLGRLKSTLREGQDFIARTTNYKKRGEPFEIEWIITHLKDDEGQTTHYIALQRDITGMDRAKNRLEHFDNELRAAKSQLIETTHQLESIEGALAERARLSTLGEISAGVIHDLSNALTPVFTLVQLLHSFDNLPENARTLVRDMDMSIEHAINLLTNLRDYHSSRSGKPFEPIELRALIQRLPDITKGKWASITRSPDAGISFAFELENGAVILGSEVEILQVLVNLVLNAIDAMPNGGTIAIGLTTLENAQVRITVADTGVGMSKELAETCFEPYVKGRSAGTGLGLSVCRRIVSAHGGSIIAIPGDNQGATFRINLPLRSATERESEKTLDS